MPENLDTIETKAVNSEFQTQSSDKSQMQSPAQRAFTKLEDEGGEDGPELEYAEECTRTKSTLSIAQTLPLPHEIAFVATICMAQVMTRS
jgi:hypothetical protein